MAQLPTQQDYAPGYPASPHISDFEIAPDDDAELTDRIVSHKPCRNMTESPVVVTALIEDAPMQVSGGSQLWTRSHQLSSVSKQFGHIPRASYEDASMILSISASGF